MCTVTARELVPAPPPELLYGARDYGFAVDIWAMGCVLGEMMTNGPLFPGESDIDQLFKVFLIVGTPNLASWPDAASLPDFGKLCFQEQKPRPWNEVLPGVSSLAMDCVARMLSPNPNHRPSAHAAMLHDFFHSSNPPACPPERLRTGISHATSDVTRGFAGDYTSGVDAHLTAHTTTVSQQPDRIKGGRFCGSDPLKPTIVPLHLN